MKKIILATAFFITVNSFCFSQEMETENKIIIPKHEIGFSVGAFPIIALDPPKDRFMFGEYMYGHTSFIKWNNRWGDENYKKRYHYGSYAMNYNYNFNSKRSAGVSLAWMGMHIDRYSWISIYDTINGSGWNHYFTLMGNYRRTYYRKNNISLYWGIYSGIKLCVRDKDILYKETYNFLLSSISNDRYFSELTLHLNAFGIDIGTKHILNMELGIGSLGILRAGYKYRFDIVPVVNLQK